MRGWRKLVLGLLYIIISGVCIETAILRDAGAGVIAAVASAVVAIAPGVGVIIWGNVETHRAQATGNGNAK